MTEHDDSKVPRHEAAGLALGGAVLVFLPVLLVGLVILGFSNSGADGPSAESPVADVALGEDTYRSACASCHGASGEGGVGPAMEGVAERYPDIDDQIAIVVGGKNAMPAFGAVLTDEQVRAVVEFEREILGG